MNVTPDGVRYVASTKQRVAKPFHYRWLLPAVCGENETRWRIQAWGSVALLCAAGALYTHSWLGAVLPLGLSGVVKFNLKHPVLVDAAAMALALSSAVAWKEGWWYVAIPLVLVAGCTKETAPVFAALYAWHPVLLVGLLAPALRHLQSAGPDVLDAENRWVLDHPLAASRKYHANFAPWAWVLPWGVLLAGFADPTLMVCACVLVAYAQCLVATDSVRLYQWCWPALALHAIPFLPTAWLLPLLLVHLASPFATEGG